MILRFKDFDPINEVVKNLKSTQAIADDICEQAKKLVLCKTRTEVRDSLIISIYGLKRSNISVIENLLSKYQKEVMKQDLILSFGEDKSAAEFESIKIVVHLKSIYSIRVKPQRYVYHFSMEDKESILKNGLQPRQSDSSKSWKNPALSYPPAVFAIDDDSTLWSVGTCFEIDTQGLNNKWWRDLNFRTGPAIMTFDSIPADHIRVISSSERSDREKVKKVHAASLSSSAAAEEMRLSQAIESGDMELLLNSEPPSINSKASRSVAKYGTKEVLDWFFSKQRSDREIQVIANSAATAGNLVVSEYLDAKFPGVVDKARIAKMLSYSKR